MSKLINYKGRLLAYAGRLIIFNNFDANSLVLNTDALLIHGDKLVINNNIK